MSHDSRELLTKSVGEMFGKILEAEKLNSSLFAVRARDEQLSRAARMMAGTTGVSPVRNYPIQCATAELLTHGIQSKLQENLQSIADELGVPVANITITRD